GDDEAPPVREFRMHDLRERVVGVADLAFVGGALRETAAHAAVLRDRRAAQARADVFGCRESELARYEREHEVRRAVRVHCIPAVALARKRLEPGRFLSGIRRIGLVDELLAGEEVVPGEEVLGIEPPREPGVVVRTLGWPVRR